MTPEEIHTQREIDEEILYYVRSMQGTAPIRIETIERYLQRVRNRRGLTSADVLDRVKDLVDRDLLDEDRQFEAGEGYVDYYEVTAKARRCLDGAEPWEWQQ